MNYAYFSHQRNSAASVAARQRLRSVSPCACGAENKLRGKLVGPACWAAAPPNLRRELLDPADCAVRLAAARRLVDFALSRNPHQQGRAVAGAPPPTNTGAIVDSCCPQCGGYYFDATLARAQEIHDGWERCAGRLQEIVQP